MFWFSKKKLKPLEPLEELNQQAKLSALNQHIQQLNQQRTKLLEEQEKSKIEQFRKLDWTSEYDVVLEINPLVCAGLARYHILVPGLKHQTNNFGYFGSTNHLFVFGDEKLPYEYNITYKSSDYNIEYPSFFTSCNKRLIEFLSKVKFKSVRYDETSLEVLLAAKAANDAKIDLRP